MKPTQRKRGEEIKAAAEEEEALFSLPKESIKRRRRWPAAPFFKPKKASRGEGGREGGRQMTLLPRGPVRITVHGNAASAEK